MELLVRLNLLYTVFFCALFISCDDDDYPYANLPSVVLNGFRAEFSDAKDIEFKKTGEHYEVEFEIDQDDAAAMLDSTGTILKERREVSWKDLPSQIQISLDSEFGKEKIEDPEIITVGDKVYYQVQIQQFLMDKKLVFDANGKPDASLEYWD